MVPSAMEICSVVIQSVVLFHNIYSIILIDFRFTDDQLTTPVNCVVDCSALMHAQNPLHSSSSSISSEGSCQKSSDLKRLSAALYRHRKKMADCRRYVQM